MQDSGTGFGPKHPCDPKGCNPEGNIQVAQGALHQTQLRARRSVCLQIFSMPPHLVAVLVLRNRLLPVVDLALDVGQAAQPHVGLLGGALARKHLRTDSNKGSSSQGIAARTLR